MVWFSPRGNTHKHSPIPKPKINADRNQIEILLLSAFPNIIKCSKWSLACNATSWNGSFDVGSMCVIFLYAFRFGYDCLSIFNPIWLIEYKWGHKCIDWLDFVWKTIEPFTKILSTCENVSKPLCVESNSDKCVQVVTFVSL